MVNLMQFYKFQVPSILWPWASFFPCLPWSGLPKVQQPGRKGSTEPARQCHLAPGSSGEKPPGDLIQWAEGCRGYSPWCWAHSQSCGKYKSTLEVSTTLSHPLCGCLLGAPKQKDVQRCVVGTDLQGRQIHPPICPSLAIQPLTWQCIKNKQHEQYRWFHHNTPIQKPMSKSESKTRHWSYSPILRNLREGQESSQQFCLRVGEAVVLFQCQTCL